MLFADAHVERVISENCTRQMCSVCASAYVAAVYAYAKYAVGGSVGGLNRLARATWDESVNPLGWESVGDLQSLERLF